MPNPEKERKQLINDYHIVFSQMPELKDLASSYWDKVGSLDSSDKNVLETEERILKEIVIQMANILLDNPVFQKAMEKANADPVNNAILESLAIIDIIPDLRANESYN